MKSREEKGSTIIKDLMLLHTKSKVIQNLTVGIIQLEKSLKINEKEISTVLILLVPDKVDEKALETMGVLSESIIENTNLLDILHQGSKAEIYLELEKIYTNYFKKKYKKGNGGLKMSEAKAGNVAQEKMQKFGRFLSGMVMPNIGAFIAWGLLTALFIPTGWIPNEYLAAAGGPMSKWLIPLLIGYSGGSAIYQHRGGVLGAIATAGIIAGSDIPMFLGAMIVGPFGGWCIKKFDEAFQDKIPTGFEMLINNFSAGILGGILAILAYAIVGPVVSSLNDILRGGVEFIVNLGLIPLVSILVEPAKVLFLNNAINHGVFSPIGIQESQELGNPSSL